MPLLSLSDAERDLGGISSVALGGMLLENRPSALVRALVRSGARDLLLTSAPAASWDADVLIGAGRVATVRIPHISLASIGLAPATRRAAAAGAVRFEDCDEALLLGGYLAANHQAPMQLLHNLGTNDLVDDNPLLIRSSDLVGVAPLRVDVALLHAPVGDAEGNLAHYGSRWADLLIARAASRVVAQVDQIVSSHEIARLGVAVPGYLVDDVIEVPYGAHPCGSVGAYVADLDHLTAYREQVNAGGFADYVAQWCEIPHDKYLAQLATGHLHELRRHAA